MRRHYHHEVRSRLIGELAKDLTGHTVEVIAAALSRE
jgi:protein required for attachment to host cells